MFKVQKLTAARIWTTLMSNIMCEQQAIRFANVTSSVINERLRVVSDNDALVYITG
tara:strand:- start:665 stop:832 length:168 start_codon:yes stop_codon:yes gene_type:complete